MEVGRVLVIINTMDCGGAETFMMKVMREIVKDNIVLDFLINKAGDCYYEEEINKLGGIVYRGVSKSQNLFKSMSIIKKFVKDGAYKTVFIIAVHPVAIIDIMACKMGGAKVILTRSTTSGTGGIFSKVLAKACCGLTFANSSECYAPSTEAAEWLFGKRNVDKVKILKNGIDISQYIYDPQIREKKRKELKIGDETFVVGHVGRFSYPKNHGFLLQVFHEIWKMEKNAVLMLIGKGELREQILKQAEQLNISSQILFMGIRSDVNELYTVMDVMIFPSLYEGLPNVVVEAQTTGLPCLISDSITNQVKLTPSVESMSLSENASSWANKALELRNVQRQNNGEVMKEKGYDIRNTVEEIKSAII